jgi:hypothetical protein
MKIFNAVIISIMFIFGHRVFAQNKFYYSISGSIAKTANVKKVENPPFQLMIFANNPYAIIEKTTDGRFRLKPQFTAEDTKPFSAPPNAYSGKLYVLQDGLTFSAAIAYVGSGHYWLHKQARFVKFIGNEPGDDMNAGVGSGGTTAEVVLPNSRVKVRIPVLGGGDVPYSKKEKTVIPDYKVIPTAKDLVNGTDAELNFTVDLIKKKFLK